ncbi:1,5-anhydro-D-fructose reductase-like [Heteronotia binoei]|uniref:1,5-anhydro-D-fructose reductase-like n=1 Tax=Heteronotia binoei TaxID=13085 RepID=UPI0029312FF7|nr:1,5-anhydro-D-fructose reductase-like [Heteronotia binoei]
MSSIPCLTLPSGHKMPQLGLGTWLSLPENIPKAVEQALECGYRHIDLAPLYENEKEYGEAIEKALKKGQVKREDLFIVSKLWNSFHAPEDVKTGCLQSMKDLRVDYLDLYLMHSPMGIKNVKGELMPLKDGKVIFTDVDYVDTWKAMEKLVDEGLVRSIGVANFNKSQMERLLSCARIKPCVLQVERHCYQNQKELTAFTRTNKMVMTCYSPLSCPKTPFRPHKWEPKNGMEDPVVKEIAKKHGKSPAQILIRYNIQAGLATIPKSETPAHIIENAKVFDFCLTDDDVKKLESLHCGARAVPWDIHGLGEHKYYPFK